MSRILTVIPKHYRGWLSEIKIEAEHTPIFTRDCAACELPDTKCCTYFPFIPNFSLGAILSDPRFHHGMQLRLNDAAARGRLVPLGLLPTDRSASQGLCPFYECSKGLCEIWENRPGVCAAYYCSSKGREREEEPRAYLKSYLNLFEWTLAHDVLWRMGYTEDDTRKMLESGWQWNEDKTEFFKRSAQVSKAIKPEEINGLLGDEGLSLRKKIYESL